MSSPQDYAISSIATTVATRADALTLARQLMQERLAACVQIEDGAVTSLYRWNGNLCEDGEVRLTIKALPSQVSAIEAFLARHHPYDVPQFLVTDAQASKAYLDWARTQTE